MKSLLTPPPKKKSNEDTVKTDPKRKSSLKK